MKTSKNHWYEVSLLVKTKEDDAKKVGTQVFNAIREHLGDFEDWSIECIDDIKNDSVKVPPVNFDEPQQCSECGEIEKLHLYEHQRLCDECINMIELYKSGAIKAEDLIGEEGTPLKGVPMHVDAKRKGNKRYYQKVKEIDSRGVSEVPGETYEV